jgi:hypothetical protein
MADTITTADLADLLGMGTRNVRDLHKHDILVRPVARRDFRR